jgi:hypothetical protein
MVKTRKILTKSRKKTRTIKKRMKQKGGSGLNGSESSEFGSPDTTGLIDSQQQARLKEGISGPTNPGVGMGDSSSSNIGFMIDDGNTEHTRQIETITDSLNRCGKINTAYLVKHNELIDVYINYLIVLQKNNQQQAELDRTIQNAKDGNQELQKLKNVLKKLPTPDIIPDRLMNDLQKVQETIMQGVKAKSREIITDQLEIPGEVLEQILNLLPQEIANPIRIKGKVTYKEIIDLLEVQRNQIGSGGGKSKKVRKLKKYKKVFRKKSKKLRK